MAPQLETPLSLPPFGPGLPNFSRYNIPKWGKLHITNYHKIGIPKDREIDQLTIKCANMLYCGTLQNLPKIGFSV
jgi:hypothetical protein